MKKAILLVTALLICAPVSAANAVCAEGHSGGSAHVHSGKCGAVESFLINTDAVDAIVDPVICSLDNLTTIVQC